MWDCFFFKQKTAYEMRISDWSSDVCSSDLGRRGGAGAVGRIVVQFDLDVVAVVGIERGLHVVLPIVGQVAAELQGQGAFVVAALLLRRPQIGRASCRERVCQYV